MVKVTNTCPTCSWWRKSSIVQRLLMWAYTMGIVVGSGNVYGGPEQHAGCISFVKFSGRRTYVLGKTTWQWGCLIKRHHRHVPLYGNSWICCACSPCPDCGSKTPRHLPGCRAPWSSREG